MSRIIAVASNKGGVGKTTTVLNLGESLARLGQRVLLVDLDLQNGLLFGLDLAEAYDDPGLFDLLLNGGDAGERVLGLDTEGLDVLLGGAVTGDFDDLQMVLATSPHQLSETLAGLRDLYHFILIDCPAGFGGLASSALTAADEVLIPIQCHPLALRTLPVILEKLKAVRSESNPNLTLTGILLTMYDPALEAKESVAEQIWRCFPSSAVLGAVIPRSEHFISQFSGGGPVVYAQPESPGALAYLKLAAELSENAAMR